MQDSGIKHILHTNVLWKKQKRNAQIQPRTPFPRFDEGTKGRLIIV